MTQSEQGRIPADSFRVRIAIVRTEMGWNYEEASAATGVGSESWRQWEKGLRHCTDVITVSRKIAAATGYDETWLALGGSLGQEVTPVIPPPRTKRKQPVVAAVSSPVRTRTTKGVTRGYTAQSRASRGSLSVTCSSLSAA